MSNFSRIAQKQVCIQHVKRLLTSKFQKLKAIDSQERLEQYLNAYLKVHDVQTEYLSKAQKEKWTQDFNRTLVGIGARIEIIDEFPQITELTIGGSVWKSQQIEEGDVILKIAESDQAPMDALGMSIEEVIRLLRGQKGSTVHLTLKKRNGQVEEIALVRDEIDLDPAMAFILEDEQQKRKIGYVRLPRFYVGKEGCAAHVLAHLEGLKSDDIEGIVFDVRNNKGGSSREAVEIIGYFLEGGTVMQAKYRNGSHRVLEDEDTEAQYKGELLVLTNSRSGSASELFAGTMQDYGRAVIVGGKATFGKGTIQRFIGLEGTEGERSSSFGEIKMTVGNFFTASGRSPQYTGIESDIVLPDNDAFVESGERVYEYAFPHADLELVKVKQSVTSNIDFIKLQLFHFQRLISNNRFQWANDRALQIKYQQENTLVDLNYEDFKLEKEKAEQYKTNFKEVFGGIEGFKVSPLPQFSNTQDSTVIARNQRWIQMLQRDPYVYECFWIVNDLLG